MANPQDWPSKSEVFGTFETLSARLDDLDQQVLAAGGGGGPTGPLPSAIMSDDLALIDRGGTVYSAYVEEVWRQDASGGAISQSYQSSAAGGYTDGSATISATGLGSRAFGSAKGFGGVGITAQQDGSLAFGSSYNNNSQITTGAPGALAHGYAYGGGTIQALAQGATASGVAYGSGLVQASSTGSFACGYAEEDTILAGGEGSAAFGHANGGVNIQATASNSFQFGPGTNGTANTLQVGNAGLRLKGTTGAPGVLQNGDIWVANNNVYVRSGGATQNLTNVP